MINDISGGGKNFENIDLSKEYDVPIVIMHMQGNPLGMQQNPNYKNLIDEISMFFDLRLNYASKIGLNLDKIILDPGIGFGKSFNNNYEIIKNINEFKKFNCKILIGLSRKSMLNFNNNLPKDRLYKSLTMQAISVLNDLNTTKKIESKFYKKELDSINKLISK